MKRLFVGILLVILATSYFVQKEHILKGLERTLVESLQPAPAIVQEKPKPKPRQDTELMAYPAPGEPLLPYPAPLSPIRTPLPTATIILPTPAPTMNPWGD
jgi:hypothetical protein